MKLLENEMLEIKRTEIIQWAEKYEIEELLELFTCKSYENPCLHVRSLNLSKKGLEELPDFLFEFTGLKELNLSHNHLQTLPTEIAQLSKLEFLDISWNHIVELPEFLFSMKKLKLNKAWNRKKGEAAR